MAKQTINPGTAPTGAGGDTFRSGSAKLQANDDEIYNYLGDGTNLNKLGTAAFKNTGTQAGNVMEVGAFGLGGFGQPWVDNFKDIGAASFFSGSMDEDIGEYVRSAGVTMPYGLGISAQLVSTIATNPRVQIRSCIDGVWSAFLSILHTGNVTTDANGFIKAASPIVKLFSDKIELNDEAKQQGITFERLDTGDYLIKGSSGFAQEGWYIETPKDANGNVLFSVIYEALENGDISVKTYKKKFDFETVSIVADLDNPVDITKGRWIDLRLQELPQPEIEEPESATPPDFQPTGLAEAVATAMESYNDTEQ